MKTRSVPAIALLLSLAVPVPASAQTPVPPSPLQPGKSGKFVYSSTAPATEGDAVTVPPGPDPWYSLFSTGEVIGYIEPCG